MKIKRNVVVGIILILLPFVFTACGKKQKASQDAAQSETDQKPETETVLVDAEPAVPASITPGELVNMQKAIKDEYSDITKVMGNKTPAAYRLPITNQTGGEISEIFIRPAVDGNSDDWGQDLVNQAFTMRNQEKALYYFNKDEIPDTGTSPAYDIRVSYTDSRSDCFFRKLPLSAMKELRLCMEGTGEDGIPYARFTLSSNGSEQSTLEEVKIRLGLIESEQDETESSSDTDDAVQSSDESEASQEEAVQPSGETAENQVEEPYQDEQAIEAGNYVCQPLENLISAMGDPGSSEYAEEPETGQTGYHYYDTFTVSTRVDENGNEIVSGIW